LRAQKIYSVFVLYLRVYACVCLCIFKLSKKGFYGTSQKTYSCLWLILIKCLCNDQRQGILRYDSFINELMNSLITFTCLLSINIDIGYKCAENTVFLYMKNHIKYEATVRGKCMQSCINGCNHVCNKLMILVILHNPAIYRGSSTQF
jgi:hypothetical protein